MAAQERIGFDRELRLEWLDAAAAQAAKSTETEVARRWLDGYLTDSLGGKGTSGHRGKTITVLRSIWLAPPDNCVHLRDRALTLLHDAQPGERLAAHWGLVLAVYPFFGDVTDTVGRLLALQGDVQRIAVVRRMYEGWGERPAVSRATRAAWYSLIWWGVLAPSERRGRYRAQPKRVSISRPLVEFLIEAAIVWSQSRPLVLSSIPSLPCLFPFDMSDAAVTARKSHHVRVSREGIDLEVVRTK
ncbi:MAG: hypothetical protein GX616_05885 [Planctomycetes bacterium]|nr:hypothetical protein [Planctomycetota bacterium]